MTLIAHFRPSILIVLLALLLAPRPSAGQGTQAPCTAASSADLRVISGRITDAQGASVPGASVTFTCGSTTRREQSDGQGRVSVTLPDGQYTVRVERAGFTPATQQVTVSASDDQSFEVRLAVAQLSESLTVRASSPEVPRRTQTATRTDTPLLETPQSVTVITSEQIRDQGSPNLQEALRYTPGVRHELYGIDNRGDWVSLRGSDESTMLLDGMRLPLTGWYGVVRSEPYAFEQVDVVRGPASIIAGQNDPGGVVNMVSKRPQAQPRREFGVRLGNYNRREIQADLTGPINESSSLLYRLVALGKDSDTQIRHADEQRTLIAPSLTWRDGTSTSVTAYGEYQRDRSKNTNAFLGLAGTLHPAPNGPIPTDLFIGEPDWDTYGGTRWRMGYATEFALRNGWQLRHNLRHDRVEGLMESMYAAWWDGFVDERSRQTPDGRHLGRLWYIYDDRSEVTTTEVLLQGRANTGRVSHSLLFGVDGMTHDASQASASGTGTPLDVYAPVYGSFERPSLGEAEPTDNRIRRVGFLAQDQMKIDRVSVRAGLRQDKVRNAVVGGEVAEQWATSGNVGLVYEVVPGVAPYASYSQSFNPVSGTDAAGSAFKPKRGEQVEAGVKWEAASLPIQATAAVYSLTERNRLAADPVNVGQSVQIGKARIKGVELEARSTLGAWNLSSSYTFLRARASATGWGGDLDPTQQLEGIPEHSGSVWATHRFARLGLPGVELGGGLRLVGRIGDGTGNVFVPSVTLVDLMAAFERDRWRFAVNANNVTDKAYIATCLARGDCWFGQRRTVSLTAGFRY